MAFFINTETGTCRTEANTLSKDGTIESMKSLVCDVRYYPFSSSMEEKLSHFSPTPKLAIYMLLLQWRVKKDRRVCRTSPRKCLGP